MSSAPVPQQQRKKRTFRTLSYRGVPLEKLIDMSTDELLEHLPARCRRKYSRGTINKTRLARFLRKLDKAKAECPHGQRPKAVRTHYRNMIVLPQMVGSQIAIYNGKVFMDVEIKTEMIGHYLGEFAITYKPVTHGKYGATTSKVTNSKLYQVHY